MTPEKIAEVFHGLRRSRAAQIAEIIPPPWRNLTLSEKADKTDEVAGFLNNADPQTEEGLVFHELGTVLKEV